MTISEIITKYYDELHDKCEKDVAISMSRTGEDILQDVCITAMRKYKEKNIDEEEAIKQLEEFYQT